MKVKLDENIPARLVDALRRLGHEVDTVASEGMQGRTDAEVWNAAQREQRYLITQDLDFSDLRRFKPGTHAGLLFVRLREPGAGALSEAHPRGSRFGGARFAISVLRGLDRQQAAHQETLSVPVPAVPAELRASFASRALGRSITA